MVDLYKSGRYSFVKEIEKGGGNIREYFPRGLAPYLPRGIAPVPTVEALKPKGDYNQAFLKSFRSGQAGLVTDVLHNGRKASGIRSQRRRLSRLPNVLSREAPPRKHPNKSRALVS